MEKLYLEVHILSYELNLYTKCISLSNRFVSRTHNLHLEPYSFKCNLEPDYTSTVRILAELVPKSDGLFFMIKTKQGRTRIFIKKCLITKVVKN